MRSRFLSLVVIIVVCNFSCLGVGAEEGVKMFMNGKIQNDNFYPKWVYQAFLKKEGVKEIRWLHLKKGEPSSELPDSDCWIVFFEKNSKTYYLMIEDLDFLTRNNAADIYRKAVKRILNM